MITKAQTEGALRAGLERARLREQDIAARLKELLSQKEALREAASLLLPMIRKPCSRRDCEEHYCLRYRHLVALIHDTEEE